MNFKTTFSLVVLLVAGGALWLTLHYLQPREPSSATLDFLAELRAHPDKITRIEVKRGERTLVLERSGDDWNMPGNWPTRKHEVKQLVTLLSNLQSRFAPEQASADRLAQCGLDKPAVTVILRAFDQDYRLQFGEEVGGDANVFSRPTFLHLESASRRERKDQVKMKGRSVEWSTSWPVDYEIVRLGPGIVGQLDRAPDYYQQRRLFVGERLKKGDVSEKEERLTAQSIGVEGPTGVYTLVRSGTGAQAEWELSQPVKDRADPDKLATLLTAIPDIWVEQFVPPPAKELKEYGLDQPQTLTVTNDKGKTLTLLIGKESQKKARTITTPAPPGPPGMPPRPPTRQVIHEEYRFAKLKDNDQVFEIKADKLKDLFVVADTLRDARLARFRADDARKLVIARAGLDIVLEKVKDRWKLKQNAKEIDAETSRVTELLDKLANLEARDKDILDKADDKALGLEPPAATLTVHVEEAQGEGDSKTTKSRSITFNLGKRDEDKKKLYARVQPWERVNAVEDSLDKLVQRPALAYRGRRLLDFASSDLSKVEVAGKFTLEQDKDVWRLTAPERADVDATKAGQLIADLARLEAVEFVNDQPTADDLDKLYGLAQPSLTLAVTYSKSKMQKLLLGKQRGDRPEYFARLDGDPSVFVVKKEFRDLIEQSSLALLPLQFWQLKPTDIAELRIQKDAKEYRLERDGKNWRLHADSYQATGMPGLIDPLVNDVAGLRGDKYVAHAAKDLGAFGLDKPYLRLVLVSKNAQDKKDDKKDDLIKPDEKLKEVKKERVLLIGKPSADGAKSRFAKLGDGEAVFVVGEKLITAVDHGPLDLIERKLLTLDPRSITGIQSTTGPLAIQRKDDAWAVEAGPVKFTADRDVMSTWLGIWANLHAERFAAYGDKVDLKGFGLDQPAAIVTVTLKKSDDKDAEKHLLVLGKKVDKGAGRYARLDNGPGVFVLSASTSGELMHSYLDLVERNLLKFDAGAVSSLQRKMGNDELEVVKKEEKWSLAKPQALPADAPTLEELFKDLGSLRAQSVAAYPAKDFKPFGLDAPVAVLTLNLGSDDKKQQHVLKIGKPVAAAGGKPAGGDRYVVVDKSEVVGVLPAALAQRLLAGPLHFRDHVVARLKDEVDRVRLERGARKAVFAKVDGTWKMTSPLSADAEQADLDDFINALSRLRADDLVAEKADPKQYGLDRPATSWKFFAGDKEVLGLTLGGLAPDGKRYATLAGSDLVFLLNATMAGQALAEYRSRSVWPPLDAAQVEMIRFNYLSNPFTLEKVGPLWTVQGKLDTKIRSEAVSETLDALARLKAERYVSDKDADLKLYGLEPPELALEVQTRTGKRTLYVGRAEGDSKRFYARVAEDQRTEVFLIAEADAAKILRRLGDFTAKEEKKSGKMP